MWAPLAFPAPTAVPPTSPTPAPAAAPTPGFPAAAPSAAPAAAPTAVPITAPLTVLFRDAVFADVPSWSAAHWRQTATSLWYTSKLLPEPGSTMTFGPVGTLAHPATRAA